MGRKVLQSIANTLPEIVAGRMDEDLERFAEHPSARVEIDVLRRTAHGEDSEPLSLAIVDDVADWFATRLKAEKIPVEEVSAAKLTLEIRTDRVATDQKRIVLFTMNCRCTISTADRTYEGRLEEKLRWHRRISNDV